MSGRRFKERIKVSTLALSQIPNRLSRMDMDTVRSYEKERKECLSTFRLDEAQDIMMEKTAFLKNIQEGRVQNEKTRQEEERKKFETVFDLRHKKAEKESESLLKQETERWERRRREMSLLHERERTDLKSKFRRTKPKIRYSKVILELKEKELALVKGGRFEEVKNLRPYRFELESKERKAILKTFRAKKRKQYEQLLSKQKWEIDNFKRKKKKGMFEFERKRKLSLGMIKKQRNNLLFDMNRSHRLEFRNINTSRNKIRRPKTSRISQQRRRRNTTNLSRPKTSRPKTSRPSSSFSTSRRKIYSKIDNSPPPRAGKRRFSSSSYFGSILHKKEVGRGKRNVIPSLVDLYVLNKDETIYQ